MNFASHFRELRAERQTNRRFDLASGRRFVYAPPSRRVPMKKTTYHTEMTFAAAASAPACVLGNPGALRGRPVR
jgi:hypothetical protein